MALEQQRKSLVAAHEAEDISSNLNCPLKVVIRICWGSYIATIRKCAIQKRFSAYQSCLLEPAIITALSVRVLLP